MKNHLVRSKINDADICIADSATTYTIFKNKKYFSHLTLGEVNVNTRSDNTKLIESFKRANILLPSGTKFIIEDALLSTKDRKSVV